MKKTHEVIESEIIKSLQFLRCLISGTMIEWWKEIPTEEQERMVENIDNELKKLRNVVCQNIHEEMEWQRIIKTPEYKLAIGEGIKTEKYFLKAWRAELREDEPADCGIGYNTKDRDKAIENATDIMLQARYTNGIISNCNEKIYLQRKDDEVEIVKIVEINENEN